MKKRLVILIVFIFLMTLLMISIDADEGMWPISEIGKLDLRSKGLEISTNEIFNPDGLSLIHAVVQVGATGYYFTKDVLIITNHNVEYGDLQAASTEEKD